MTIISYRADVAKLTSTRYVVRNLDRERCKTGLLQTTKRNKARASIGFILGSASDAGLVGWFE